MVLKQLDVPMQKNKSRQRPTLFTKISSKLDHRHKRKTQNHKTNRR